MITQSDFRLAVGFFLAANGIASDVTWCIVFGIIWIIWGAFFTTTAGWTPPEEKKNQDVFRDLCQEVLDYYERQDKYNFSHLSPYDRDNEAFDAWQLIRERIRQALT